jgi:hypothetical protein
LHHGETYQPASPEGIDQRSWRDFINCPRLWLWRYDSVEMKRWRSLILALVVVGLVAFCGPHLLEKRAQQKREIAYELALRSYSEHFRPGMTRKEVEDYLRGRNIGFQQMCCVDDKLSSKGVWDDITKIGKESAPWSCSENNVYVAFQFIGPARSGVGWGADPSDTLKSVSIYHWLEGCL